MHSNHEDDWEVSSPQSKTIAQKKELSLQENFYFLSTLCFQLKQTQRASEDDVLDASLVFA